MMNLRHSTRKDTDRPLLPDDNIELVTGGYILIINLRNISFCDEVHKVVHLKDGTSVEYINIVWPEAKNKKRINL